MTILDFSYFQRSALFFYELQLSFISRQDVIKTIKQEIYKIRIEVREESLKLDLDIYWSLELDVIKLSLG